MKPTFLQILILLLWPCCALSQVYILDEQFNSAPTIPATLTGTGGPFGSVSGASNFGRNAPALTLNTSGQRLQYGPWTGNADHICFYHKGTTGAGSTMLVEESANGVVWTLVQNVTAITTSATFDANLLPTSRYMRITFSLVATCNVYLDDLRIRSQTDACTDNIQILEMLINGGCGTCEGSEEFIYFDTGGNPLDISYMELVSQTVAVGGNSYGGNGPGNNLNTNWVLASSYTALQNAYISNLNLWAGCSGVFVPVPATNILPANARVMAFTGAIPTATYNMSAICGLGTVYIIFANQLNCSGKYGNSSCSSNCTRFITLFNHQTGCIGNQQYMANSSNTAAGNGYIFVGPNIGYTNTSNCSLLVLSVKFKSFSGVSYNQKNQLDWVTSTEEELVEFQIERSTNGVEFEKIGFLAALNSLVGGSYTFIDEEPNFGTNYYRIIGLNTNGSQDVSDMIAIDTRYETLPITIRQSDEYIEVINNTGNKNISIKIFNTSGSMIYDSGMMQSANGYFKIDSSVLHNSGVLLILATDGFASAKYRIYIP